MKRPLLALFALSFLSACAQSTATPNEIYPHPPGSMGNPAARATLLTGVTVLLLTAVVVHVGRDQ